ncbi:MAG: hypothetical protein RLZZ333_2082 [Bacteroidota bacterium]
MKQLFILLICFNLSAVAQDSISKSTVQQASQLMDVKFTEKEIEMMLQDLKDNLVDYKKMHALLLNNNIAMSAAQRLQPDNAIQQKINWQYNKKIQLPSNKNELAFYSIHQLGSLLRNKLISSKELTAFFIERIKKYGDTLECVVSITQDIAMQQAAQADDDFKKGIDRGPLQGIPYGLKDLFAVKGTKTTCIHEIERSWCSAYCEIHIGCIGHGRLLVWRKNQKSMEP